jgi:hypothetical protein
LAKAISRTIPIITIVWFPSFSSPLFDSSISFYKWLMRPHQPFVKLAWFIAEAADFLGVKLRRLGVLPNDFFIKLFAD